MKCYFCNTLKSTTFQDGEYTTCWDCLLRRMGHSCNADVARLREQSKADREAREKAESQVAALREALEKDARRIARFIDVIDEQARIIKGLMGLSPSIREPAKVPKCKLCMDDGWFRDNGVIVACPICHAPPAQPSEKI